MNSRKSVSIAILSICFILFSFPSFISAHAYIVKSNPSENEVLKQSPQIVSIQFDETIQPINNSIQVFDKEGKRVDQKDGRINAKNSTILECGLKQNLPNGTYSIQWKIVSSDGHPIQGTISFQIGSDSQAQDGFTVGQESKGYTPKLDLILIRWVQYFSNACYVGILFFFLLVMPGELKQNDFVKNVFKRIVKFSFFFLCLSIFLSLPLMASIQLTTSWSNVLNIQSLRDMITNTTFGKTWMIQVDTLFFLAICTYLISVKNKPIVIWVSFFLGIGLLFTKAQTSHAGSSTNPILSVGIDFFHLLTASIWVGSILVLAVLIPLSRKMDTKNHYMEMIRRFSKWGIMLIVVLTVTGVFGSFSYIPNLCSLVYTDYGRVLSGKVILLIIMIIFAAMNFYKGRLKSAKGISASLWGELVTGLIVLILSVKLTNLPTAMASPGPINETKTVDNGNKITFEASPNVIGENTFELFLKDRNGQPIKDVEQVTLTFISLEMEMGEDTKTLMKVKEGEYIAKGMNFNMAGRWKVHVHVLTKELESINTDFNVMVGSQ
ncbi:copper resistance CopC/CopD family protein [Neobacillus sp. GCM10023253]|uniref:copper resistance CopC/CopD family protein n=1 Tax=Neobacillus sp. GCM10023253 TaxID=3252644 RepID=UPI00360DD911